MPAHPTVVSFNDAIYAISASLPATYDEAGYGATNMTYTNIAKVESFPEFGSEQALIEFTPVSGDVEYVKGARRYGQGPMVVGDLPSDPGQQVVAAAADSSNHYSMKITYPDGEIHYLDVLVASWRLTQSADGQIMKRTALIGLCKKPVVVAAA